MPIVCSYVHTLQNIIELSIIFKFDKVMLY